MRLNVTSEIGKLKTVLVHLPGREIDLMVPPMMAQLLFDDILYGQRCYFAVSFVLDPGTRRWRDFQIIAARDQFAPGPAKRPDLVDVVFSSGIETIGAITRLYAGTSDAEAQWVEIAHPFAAELSAERESHLFAAVPPVQNQPSFG